MSTVTTLQLEIQPATLHRFSTKTVELKLESYTSTSFLPWRETFPRATYL